MIPCEDCGGIHFDFNAENDEVCTSCGLTRPPHFDLRRSAVSSDAPDFRSRKPDDPALTRIIKKHSSAHRSIQARWISELNTLGYRAGLNECIIRSAVDVYELAISKPDWKNRKRENQYGVLVACLFHACNVHACHRTPAELCCVLGVDQRCARRMVKVVQKAADKVRADFSRSSAGVYLPQEVVPRYIQNLDITERQLKALRIECSRVYDAVRPYVDNHRPDTICAGLVAASLKHLEMTVSDDQVAAACLVSPNTVRLMTNKIKYLVNS